VRLTVWHYPYPNNSECAGNFRAMFSTTQSLIMHVAATDCSHVFPQHADYLDSIFQSCHFSKTSQAGRTEYKSYIAIICQMLFIFHHRATAIANFVIFPC